MPRTTTKRQKNIASLSKAVLDPSALRSNSSPLVTKKKGTKKPKPTAVSFDSNALSS